MQSAKSVPIPAYISTVQGHAFLTNTGMPLGSHKKAELHFVVSLCVCVGDVQCPKGAMTESQKGLRDRNMSLYSVRNYLIGFRRISGVNILVQKWGFQPFGGRLASLNKYHHVPVRLPLTTTSCSGYIAVPGVSVVNAI